MKKYLFDLGFNKKEADIYLALAELGNNCANNIAKKTKYPKTTVLFVLDKLVKKGFVNKSYRGKTQYFTTDANIFAKNIEEKMQREEEAKIKMKILLAEITNPFSSPPKTVFFEGIENCKKAYWSLLESKTEIIEFGSFGDMENKFGQNFMQKFIKERIKRKIAVRVIGKKETEAQKIKKQDKKELRQVKFYPEEKGIIHSAISIYENKVLLLNIKTDAFAILIENQEFAETIKTLHNIIW